MVTASVDRRERPRQPRRIKGKGWALLLAIAVQVGFLAVLIFSVQWQRRAPEAMSVELYAPPTKTPAPEPAPPPPAPKVEMPPPPKVEPPPPAPKAEPTPPPKPPAPVVEKPDTRAVDIALKAKQEQERKRKEEQERVAREEAAKAKLAEEKRKQDDRLKAEAKERERRQQQEVAAMRAQLERETAMRDQAAREQQQRQQQQLAALNKGLDDWTSRIRSKIKGNVIVPPDIAGNPEAIFDVVQLPTGEIIEATLRKSSGNRAYDEAVQRAILKSSPLPRPDRPELFQRVLNLRFRPLD